ncbi:MAG TPA: PfkB family carbohydrate kinase [Stellaceae bacterium]|jgi:D-beta-D-heptose 7-phosphate kinase/D-beta-D-heptose 1-phosphate adenosyltransferase|nr:PfkB family carbohydrate kinase [Stellaceae bacterium]
MAKGGEPALDIDRLQQARVLCIGDVMLDQYVYGEVGRLSPEAPVPVLGVDSETYTLGGAGNVLRNLAALGAGMSFVSVVGNDDAGREVQNLLAELDGAEIHVLVQPERKTTLKTRFIAINQHLLRVDRESAIPLGPYIRDDLLRLAHELVTSHNVVVISDYAKGVLTDGVAFEIIKEAREAGAQVVVEPRGGDHIRYRGADLLMPNRRELAAATGMPVASELDIVVAAQSLIERCGFGAVMVPLAREGMMLVEPRSSAVFETMPHGENYDAGGTDDTAVAVMAAGLGAGLTRSEAAHLTGLAVGIVCDKTGNAVASVGELAAALAAEAASEAGEAGLRVEMAAQPRRRSQREA